MVEINPQLPGYVYLNSQSPQDKSQFQMMLNLGMFPGGMPTNPLLGLIAQRDPTPNQEDWFSVEYSGVLKTFPYDKVAGTPRSQRQTLNFYKRVADYGMSVCPLVADMTLSTPNIIRQTQTSLGASIEAYQFDMTEKFMTNITGNATVHLSRGLPGDASTVYERKTLIEDAPSTFIVPAGSGTAPRTDLTYEEWHNFAEELEPQSTLITDDLGGRDTIIISAQDLGRLVWASKSYGANNDFRNRSQMGLLEPQPWIELGGRQWHLAVYRERNLADRQNALTTTPFVKADPDNAGYSFRLIPFIKKNACIMSPTIVSMGNWRERDTQYHTWYDAELVARFAALRVSGSGLGFIYKRFKDSAPDIPFESVDTNASYMRELNNKRRELALKQDELLKLEAAVKMAADKAHKQHEIAKKAEEDKKAQQAVTPSETPARTKVPVPDIV